MARLSVTRLLESGVCVAFLVILQLSLSAAEAVKPSASSAPLVTGRQTSYYERPTQRLFLKPVKGILDFVDDLLDGNNRGYGGNHHGSRYPPHRPPYGGSFHGQGGYPPIGGYPPYKPHGGHLPPYPPHGSFPYKSPHPPYPIHPIAPPHFPHTPYGPAFPHSPYGPAFPHGGHPPLSNVGYPPPLAVGYGGPHHPVGPHHPKPIAGYGVQPYPQPVAGYNHHVLPTNYGAPHPIPAPGYVQPKPIAHYGPPALPPQPVPGYGHTHVTPVANYGPPAHVTPVASYGPPAPVKPVANYGPPAPPVASYGPPTPVKPVANYGPPAPVHYGPPAPVKPVANYGPPAPVKPVAEYAHVHRPPSYSPPHKKRPDPVYFAPHDDSSHILDKISQIPSAKFEDQHSSFSKPVKSKKDKWVWS